MMKEEIRKNARQFKMAVAYSVRDCIYNYLQLNNISQEHGDIIFAHIYFLIGGILIITFSGAFILEQAKKGPFTFGMH